MEDNVAAPVTLAPNLKNPRAAWKPDQVEPFKASLRRFGDLGGIVYNQTTGQLVGGHKRVEVFRQSAEISVSKTDQAEDEQGTVAHGYVIVDGGRFAYREVRWSPQVEAAANLAANRWGAEWEWALVSDSLQAMANDPSLMALTGFPAHELDNLLAANWSPAEKTTLDAANPEHLHSVKMSGDQYAALQRAKAEMVAADPSSAPPSDGQAIERLVVAYFTDATP